MTLCAAEGQAVCLEGLVMRFGKGREAVTALDGINAVIPAGRITGLVGPDAAGKTTLMRIMAGLMPPSEGRASLFGFSPTELMRSQPNSIGYMPQRFGLYEDISVMANMRLHASLRVWRGPSATAFLKNCWASPALPPLPTALLAGYLAA